MFGSSGAIVVAVVEFCSMMFLSVVSVLILKTTPDGE